MSHSLDRLKIQKLGEGERKILLTAIDVSMVDMKCHYCNDPVNYVDCGIMPGLNTGKMATIICSNIMCVTEYLNDYDKSERCEHCDGTGKKK